MPRPIVAQVAGGLLGALAGQAGARTTSELIDPGSSTGYQGVVGTGASAILGALMATRGGRRRLGIVGHERTYDNRGTRTERTYVRPAAALFAGAAPFAAIPTALNTPKIVGDVAGATRGAFELKNKIQPVVNDLTDKYESYRDYIADPKNIGRDIGLSVGGGVAGYLGGGALGKLVGKLIAPDDVNASYEKRRRNEKWRNTLQTLGALGVSTVGALAAPWAYHQLPKAPEPALGGYTPAAAPVKPYVPVPSPAKTAAVNQPETNGPDVVVPAAPGWPRRNIPFGDGQGAGGWPFSASNAWLMKGTGGQPDIYSCGVTLHNKIAEAMAKLAIITCGEAKAPLEQLPQGAQFVDWTNADRKTAPAVTDPAAFEGERQKMRDEYRAKAKDIVGPRLIHLGKTAADTLKGGLGDGVPASSVDPKELAEGVEEEHKEHTADRAIAKEIAVDHLVEDPRYYTHLAKMEKQAEREPAVADHPSAPAQPLRPRAEVVVVDADGQVQSIDQRDYILFPGGGIDDGERPEHAAVREVLEELGHNVINLRAGPVVESIWPRDHALAKDGPFKGERTYFFLAVDGGDAGMKHDDVEPFKATHPQALLDRLEDLIADPKQEWAKANNEARMSLVVDSQAMNTKAIKLAQVAPMPGVPVNPNQQFVQGLTNKLKQRTAAQAPAAPAAAGASTATPAGVPASVFQPSVSQATTPAPAQPMPQAALKQSPSQLKHSSIDPVEIQAWLIQKFGALSDVGELEQPGLADAGVENNLTPRPMSVSKSVEGNIHGLPQAGQQIAFAQQDVRAKTDPQTSTLPKTADVVRVLPKKQFLLFTPDGQLVVKRLANKRFTLPEQGEGRPAPYEQPIRFTPEQGVPEAGYHGYDVGLHVGQTQDVPQGYEAVPAQSVLNDLYGGMGLSINRPYMQLDRARGRAILRQLRKLKPTATPQSVQTVAA